MLQHFRLWLGFHGWLTEKSGTMWQIATWYRF